MPKVHMINGEHETLAIVHCPGCNIGHPFRVRGEGRPMWSWNEDRDNPTFSPSMLVNQHHEPARCHSFVENGHIRFLSDCHHDLKNQTVELPELDSDGDPVK